MLDALRFVASAVAKKEFVPELTHFKIKQGRVTGFNGQIALSSDIDVDLDVQPQALALINAIRACPGTIALSVTPAGKLSVRSGKFRSYVNCLADTIAHFVEPEGETVDMGEHFLPGIKCLAPLMGIDASRPWSMGIKLHGQSMYATNNIMLAQYWHGSQLPLEAVIPAAAINELLRIDEPPTRVQMTDNSISFWFGPKRWMRSQLLIDGGWPIDKVDGLMATNGRNPQPFPDGFFDAVEKLKPFLGEQGSVYLSPDRMATTPVDEDGTSIEVELPQVTGMQAYHQKHLELLGRVAKQIDWSDYPRPCQFTDGGRMRGVIIGQKV